MSWNPTAPYWERLPGAARFQRAPLAPLQPTAPKQG